MNARIFYTALFIMIALPGCKMASSQSVKSANAENLSADHVQTESGVQAANAPENTASPDYLVDAHDGQDPVENADIQQAKALSDQAIRALSSGSFSQAFKLGVQSYVLNPARETYDMMFYAASRLTPIEQTRLDEQATTHVERAILGQLRLNHCVAQRDNACIATVQGRTADALRSVDMEAEAHQLESLALDSSKAQAPLVAVLLPLSGSDRKIGRAMLGAMLQTAGIYHHNPLSFDIRFFDTQSDPKHVAAAMQEIDQSGAKLILGPLDVKESQVAVQNLGNHVMIGFSPNASFVNEQKGVFQFSYTLEKEIQTIASQIQSWQSPRVTMIGPDDTYTSTASNLLKSQLPATVNATTMTYAANQSDLRDLAKNVAKSNPDVLFLPTTVDNSERILSFMAQENIWCAKPGTPAPKAAADMRKFVTCVTTGLWSPLPNNHRYKFVQNVIYLDYTDHSSAGARAFVTQFEALYHRAPAVHEIMPYVLMDQLNSLPVSAFESSDALKSAVQKQFNGPIYALSPQMRMVTPTGSVDYTP